MDVPLEARVKLMEELGGLHFVTLAVALGADIPTALTVAQTVSAEISSPSWDPTEEPAFYGLRRVIELLGVRSDDSAPALPTAATPQTDETEDVPADTQPTTQTLGVPGLPSAARLGNVGG